MKPGKSTEETGARETPALTRQPSDIAMVEHNQNGDSDIDIDCDNDGESDGECDGESNSESDGVYNGESERDLLRCGVTGVRIRPCERCVRNLVSGKGDGTCYNIAGSQRCKLCTQRKRCESTSQTVRRLAEELYSLRDLNDAASKKRYRNVRSDLRGVLYSDLSAVEDSGIGAQPQGTHKFTSSTKDISPSPLSCKHLSTSTSVASPRKSLSIKVPTKRPGDNLEGTRLKSPFNQHDVSIGRDLSIPTHSGQFNFNCFENYKGSPDNSTSTGLMPPPATNLSDQARSSPAGPHAETPVEEDDIAHMMAQREELATKIAKARADKVLADKARAAENTQVVDGAQSTEEAPRNEEQIRSREQNQAPSSSTSKPAWVRQAKADLGEHVFEIFRILFEVARRTD